jgi:hypothetical protein
VQGSDENKTYKRTTDFTEEGKEPSTQDAWHLAGLAHTRINELKVDQDLLKRAFLKDDLDTPDYDGHRKDHKLMIDNEKVVQEYKVSMTKDIIKWVVSFILGAVVVGLTSYVKSL